MSDPVEFAITHDEVLVIKFAALDPEGDDMIYNIDTTLAELDETLGEIRFQPDGDMVGQFRFDLVINDVVAPTDSVSLSFTINVINVNDPMDDPEITAPTSGTTVWHGLPLAYTAVCDDPDIQYGQVLEFTWSSNISGVLGIGASIQVPLDDIGLHEIHLTVSDGEYSKTTSIEVIVVESDNDGDGIADSADAFPTDKDEWVDTDGDGSGNNGDAFPDDPAASVDTDKDGYPDEWNPGMTESDSLTGLSIDYYPSDPTKWEEKKDDSPSPGVVGAIAAIGIIVGLLRRRGRR